MHLRVLREAGLVTARAEGTRRLYQLEPEAFAASRDYLDWYWTQALETFKQHVEAEGGKAVEPELKVTKSIVVDLSQRRAFELFLDHERWWPVETHHLAEPAGEAAVLEPFVGGRWYERSHDGSETDWGRVLVFEPPRRILLSWQVSSNWTYEHDPARASEIEISFVAESRRRTRVVLEHRHLERYGDQAERMRAILDRPKAAEAVLHAFEAAVTDAKIGRRAKSSLGGPRSREERGS
jgi:uncharacterized protein YndB with AHSA1/START domain